LFHRDDVPEETIKAKRRKWEAELDEAVFELYGLNEEQKDLIRDLCEVTLPFFYKPFDSIGAMQAVEKNDLSWIEKYAGMLIWITAKKCGPKSTSALTTIWLLSNSIRQTKTIRGI
jgi:hypothetical protein